MNYFIYLYITSAVLIIIEEKALYFLQTLCSFTVQKVSIVELKTFCFELPTLDKLKDRFTFFTWLHVELHSQPDSNVIS